MSENPVICIYRSNKDKAIRAKVYQKKSQSFTDPIKMSTLTVDPPAAQLPADGGQSTHTLTNGGATKVVFKVKSSNNNEYRLNPVYGFIEPGAAAPIEVTRLAGAPKEDKLVIEFGDAPDDAATPQDAFKTVTAPQKLTIPLTAQ